MTPNQLTVIQSSDFGGQFSREADAMNTIFRLEPANRAAHLGDLADRRMRVSILDVDQVLRFRSIAGVEIVRDVAGSVFHEIVFGIKTL